MQQVKRVRVFVSGKVQGVGFREFTRSLKFASMTPIPLSALQGDNVEDPVGRMRDDRVRHALVADQGGQRPRVDAGNADDAAALQPGVERPGRAVVGRLGDRRMDDRERAEIHYSEGYLRRGSRLAGRGRIMDDPGVTSRQPPGQ